MIVAGAAPKRKKNELNFLRRGIRMRRALHRRRERQIERQWQSASAGGCRRPGSAEFNASAGRSNAQAEASIMQAMLRASHVHRSIAVAAVLQLEQRTIVRRAAKRRK